MRDILLGQVGYKEGLVNRNFWNEVAGKCWMNDNEEFRAQKLIWKKAIKWKSEKNNVKNCYRLKY